MLTLAFVALTEAALGLFEGFSLRDERFICFPRHRELAFAERVVRKG